MKEISPLLYEYGKQVRDRANSIQSAPTVKHPVLCLSGQIFGMQQLNPKLLEPVQVVIAEAQAQFAA